MDRVRFGRALGYGARHAAKSLLAAADAAAAPPTAPNSTRIASPAASPSLRTGTRQSILSGSAASEAAQRIAQSVGQVRGVKQQAGKQVLVAGKQTGRSFFAPFAKFSSVVSLQVTGTFFALLALVMAQAAWRARAVVHMGWGAAEARKLYLVCGVAFLFAYFAISNFARARRRDRRL